MPRYPIPTACVLIFSAVFSFTAIHAAEKPTDLLEGAAWKYDTGEKTRTSGKIDFNVADPSRYTVLELTHGPNPRGKINFSLNGKKITGPMDGMYYRTIPAIDATLLKKGLNTLEAAITVTRDKAAVSDKAFQMSLCALGPEHLKFQTGPILGAFGEKFFTVTCRTNMPAKVSVSVKGSDGFTESEAGLIHRLRIKLDNKTRSGNYAAVADNGIRKIRTPYHPIPNVKKRFRFVAMGDSRTNPQDWAQVAAAVRTQAPDLVVFSGDMVTRGRNDWQWDEQFFAPAKDFFATTAFYAVIGNHEENAPLYNELFYTPTADGLGRNWHQQIGNVLLIGIDGDADWSSKSKKYKWLESVLSQSKANFIFLFDHYPAWTSGGHGRLNIISLPKERQVRQSQNAILPLLSKYKATAMIAGHDHFYERSEPPRGVTAIVSGGAGAPRYKKYKTAEKQNPHSKVFASALHYCLFEITDDTCTMRAITPQGKTLDTRTWKSRVEKIK